MHVCKYTRVHLGGQSTGDTADTLEDSFQLRMCDLSGHRISCLPGQD